MNNSLITATFFVFVPFGFAVLVLRCMYKDAVNHVEFLEQTYPDQMGMPSGDHHSQVANNSDYERHIA